MMLLLDSHLLAYRDVGFSTLLAMGRFTSRTLMPWPCLLQFGSSFSQTVR